MKRLHYIMALLLALLLIASPALADELGEGEARVFDYAALFSAEESLALQEQIAALKQAWPMDFVLLTIMDAEGKSARAYADDFYDYNGFGRGGQDSGLLILIDMDNREMAISTTGEMIYYLTDERIEAALDSAYAYLGEGQFAAAAGTFLQETEYYLGQGIPQDQHTYDEETGKIVRHRDLTAGEIGISALIGAIVALIIRAGSTKGYKMKGSSYFYSQAQNSAINLVNTNDQYLRSSESRTRISSSGGSGGGNRSGGGFGGSSGRSTVHRSSSGRSHGGGSRRF